MKPQTDAIFDHLKRFGSITAQAALREHGCFRLAARIKELREAGHQIDTIYITKRARGEVVRFAEYRYHARQSAA